MVNPPGLYKRGDIWWFKITHDGEVIRESTGSTDQKEAQRIHDERKAELWKVTPKLKGQTWGKAALHWATIAPRSESELLSLAKFGRAYTDRLLTNVSRESIHKALSFCQTAGTYTRYRTMIHAILSLAVKEKWLREVPDLMVKVDKKKKTRAWITEEQWERLYAELPAHLKPMARFGLFSGLRQANVLGLRWSSVDFDRRTVTIEGELTKEGEPIVVPLNDEAYDTLLECVGQDSEWVFTFRGKPISSPKTAWHAACVRAGVGHYDERGRYEGFVWHGLRHSFATWHVRAGTTLGELKELGAWKDMRSVENYAHHAVDHIARVAGNIGKKK